MKNQQKGWRFKNTFLLAISIVVLLIFADHAIIRGIISGVSELKFLGLFFSGFFIVSTFTIVPATLVLSEMSNTYGFWETALLATAGAVLGDFIIFRFIRDTVSDELRPIFNLIAKEKHIKALFSSPFFAWLTPVVGAAIIASPLPDEIGLTLLGASRMSNRRFLILVTIIDFIGICLLLSLFRML
ncbi:MAG TPA: hypothetical protein VEC17_00600 [Candidatus Binatia bacterium]|nr:hypothetical protein [Candidatus Binatia bacterium]